MSFLYVNPGYSSMCKTYVTQQGKDTSLNKNQNGACITVYCNVPVILTDIPAGTKDVYMSGNWGLGHHDRGDYYEFLYLKIGTKTAKIDVNAYKIYPTVGNAISCVGDHNKYVRYEFEFHSSADKTKAIMKWTEDNVVLYEGTVDWLQSGDDITQVYLGDGDHQQAFCNIVISDSPIPKNIQVVELPITEAENTMTKSGDNYVASAAGQSVTESLGAGTLANGTVYGICMAMDNAYYDGDGLTKIKCEFLNGNEVVQSDEKSLVDKNTVTTKSESSNLSCNIPIENISNYKVRYTAET